MDPGQPWALNAAGWAPTAAPAAADDAEQGASALPLLCLVCVILAACLIAADGEACLQSIRGRRRTPSTEHVKLSTAHNHQRHRP